MLERTNAWPIRLLCLGLVAITLLVFWPVVHSEFVSYDDGRYVTQNPNVQSGLTVDNVIWAFTSSHASNYHPLTWLSHMLDCQLFGLNAGWHHFFNLLLHIANSVILLLVLRRMTGALWPSAFVAALFALHPLHVESVAWIAERKDVLSTFFWFLGLWAYSRYVQRPSLQTYLLVVAFFVLGLMAKPMVVTFPFLLLLLDYWPLGRLASGTQGASGTWQTGEAAEGPAQRATFNLQPAIIRRLLLEKVPLFVITAISCLLTLWAQQQTVMPVQGFPLPVRLCNALISYGRYIYKTIWPAKLIVHYPYPGLISLITLAVAVSGLVMISVFALRTARHRPYLLVGWLWFLGTLVPTIGLVQVGTQAMADRYTYVPLVGIFIMLAWLAYDLVQKPTWRLALTVPAALLLIFSALTTRAQVNVWKNSETLYQHEIAIAPFDYPARYNLGLICLERGQLEQAREHFQFATQSNFAYIEAWNNLAAVLQKLGRADEAIQTYQQALQYRPNDAPTHFNLAFTLARLGRPAEAAAHFQACLQLSPQIAIAQKELGHALARSGNFNQGLDYLRDYLSSAPADAEAHVYLGEALARTGDSSGAQQEYSTAFTLDPSLADEYAKLASNHLAAGRIEAAIFDYTCVAGLKANDPDAQERLARLLVQQGRIEEAIAYFLEALRLRPDAQAHYNLALAMVTKGDAPAAIKYYRKALELKPDWPIALNDLAWILATHPKAELRNGSEAVSLAEKACELTDRKEARFLGTLDAAYAEAGRFDEARLTAEKARELALATQHQDIADAAGQRLKFYESKLPFRQEH